MNSSDYFATEDIGELRKRIDEITDQLCVAVSGDFDFTVRATVADETLDKLAMLINFLIEAARRSLTQLQAKNSSLAEIDQLKTNFIANISHELRTPLTLILAPLRSILAGQYGSMPPSTVPVIERVLRNTVRLNGLVNDLLDVSKLEAGKMDVKLAPADPSELLAILVMELEPAARERRLSIIGHTNDWPSGRLAMIDGSMFEKIALNLLSNAMKFTPEGGTITASIALRDGDIVLAVKDTGIGIPTEKIDTLFHRFQQIDSSSNRFHAGTGLGLALVKEFAELMNGFVSVSSETGSGSTFSVRLPYVETTVEVASTSLASARPATGARSEFLRMPRPAMAFGSTAAVDAESLVAALKPTILVVEDNPDLRDYVRETVSADYSVLLAANGAEALRLLASNDPDIILSDVMMPGIDGLELLRRVKAHASWKFIPFILLTARTAREERLSGLEEGADDYLAKPFDATELRVRLRAALRVRALYRELEAKNHELEIARGDLQRKVDERTYELSLQSQKAMAANKSKDQFLANMSHEMRTPLTAIIGFSDLLAGEVSSSDNDEFQATIRRNAAHLLSLIDEILDFSKIESGHVTIERAQISTPEFFAGVESTFGPMVEQRQIEFKLVLDPAIPGVLVADPKRLRQMVINLLGNAIKFTEAGSVRAEVHVIDDRGSPQLRVRVLDTGIGISLEAQKRLFAPFSQADMSLSRKFGGTGLGLALSRKIARSLGGELILESSKPGEGSVFTLWVPVEIPIQPALGSMGKRPTEDRVVSVPSSRALAGLRILLAEDSADNRLLLKRMLERAGATLEMVVDGAQAVDVALKRPFDVVLMDIQMPTLDGYSAARLLRENGFKSPILALTAHASELDLERALESGCTDRLVKPIELDQMISSILASTALTKSY